MIEPVGINRKRPFFSGFLGPADGEGGASAYSKRAKALLTL